MLRNLALLALALAAVPAAQAQQTPVAVPATAAQPVLHRIDLPAAPVSEEVPTAASRQVAEAEREGAEAAAARQGSARNVFALIGAVLVVVALVALFS
jgi:hypothetical protein